MHWFLNFTFGIELYMFRTDSLSIIRSFLLYTQQYIQVCWQLASKLLANLYDIYHWCVCSEKLLMMDRTIHTEIHTGLLTAVGKPVWHIPLVCVQWKTHIDGQNNTYRNTHRFADSCWQTCMTYTIGVCTVKNSWLWTEQYIQKYTQVCGQLLANLYDIYHWCVYSEKLLMMDTTIHTETHTGLLTAVGKPVWHIPLVCVQWKNPDDGQNNTYRNTHRFADSLRASCQQTCMTYAIAVFTVKTPDDGQSNTYRKPV